MGKHDPAGKAAAKEAKRIEREARRAYRQSPEGKEAHRIKTNERNAQRREQEPAWHQRRLEYQRQNSAATASDPTLKAERNRKIRERRAQLRREDPVWQAAQLDYHRRYNETHAEEFSLAAKERHLNRTEEEKARDKAQQKAWRATPKGIASTRSYMREYAQRPEVVAKIKAHLAKPEVKAARAKYTRERYHRLMATSPEFRLKQEERSRRHNAKRTAAARAARAATQLERGRRVNDGL